MFDVASILFFDLVVFLDDDVSKIEVIIPKLNNITTATNNNVIL